MRVFVTGGTGFIGQSLVRQLVPRGVDVRALTRSEAGARRLQQMGATPVRGDLDDLAALREGMQGVELVYHLAGWYDHRASQAAQAEKVNVAGARHVLSIAHTLGVLKIIYTSTLAVHGDTGGRIVDETYHMPKQQPFLTTYDRTKWMAHYQVALPLIEKGAPIVIVMPGIVYGPGDDSMLGQLMRAYCQGWVPVVPGGKMRLSLAYVDDVAAGHILAAERGKVGEIYHLAGPVWSLGDLLYLWAALTGRSSPWFIVPSKFLTPLAPLVGVLERIVPVPKFLTRDTVASLDVSYSGDATKARRELGWETRPVADGMQSTLRTIDACIPDSQGGRRRRIMIGAVFGALAGLLTTWLILSRRKNRRIPR